jgi:dihydroneopterin aldolase
MAKDLIEELAEAIADLANKRIPGLNNVSREIIKPWTIFEGG